MRSPWPLRNQSKDRHFLPLNRNFSFVAHNIYGHTAHTSFDFQVRFYHSHVFSIGWAHASYLPLTASRTNVVVLCWTTDNVKSSDWFTLITRFCRRRGRIVKVTDCYSVVLRPHELESHRPLRSQCL